jgi:hypothetical protein
MFHVKNETKDRNKFNLLLISNLKYNSHEIVMLVQDPNTFVFKQDILLQSNMKLLSQNTDISNYCALLMGTNISEQSLSDFKGWMSPY